MTQLLYNIMCLITKYLDRKHTHTYTHTHVYTHTNKQTKEHTRTQTQFKSKSRVRGEGKGLVSMQPNELKKCQGTLGFFTLITIF